MRLAIPATLVGIAALLGIGALYELAAPLDPVVIEKPDLPPRRAETTVRAAYVPLPLASFDEIDNRPLFSAGRAPLPESGTVSATQTAASDFVLVGVIRSGDRAVALVRSRSTSVTTSAAVGDLVSGWRVARIEPTTVILHGNGGDVTVGLENPASAPPSAPLPALSTVAPTPAPAPPSVTAPAAATASDAPVATPAKPPTVAAGTPPAKPTPGKPRKTDPTMAPEALIGAPINPQTGEPTL